MYLTQWEGTTQSDTTLISDDGIVFWPVSLEESLALNLPFSPMNFRKTSGISLNFFAICGAALHNSGQFCASLGLAHLYMQQR